MWIFSKHGFFSAVCCRQGDGKAGQPVDTDRIMVRARIRGHLEALKRRFPSFLGESEIPEFVGTDYAFRLFVQKSAWAQMLAELAQETDYDNFKSEVARYQGRVGAVYEDSLHQVWSVMHTGVGGHPYFPGTGGRMAPSAPAEGGWPRPLPGRIA